MASTNWRVASCGNDSLAGDEPGAPEQQSQGPNDHKDLQTAGHADHQPAKGTVMATDALPIWLSFEGITNTVVLGHHFCQ